MALLQNRLAAGVRLVQDGFKLSSLLPASIPPPEPLPVSLLRGGNTAPGSKGDALHGGILDSRGASQRTRGKLLIAGWFRRNVICVE